MRGSKYKNKKITVDNTVFDSEAEYKYYIFLKLRQNAGDISELKTQVTFPLNITGADGKIYKISKYIADFTYLDKNGKLNVEDVKNPVLAKGAAFRLKFKLMLALHGVEINIVSPKLLRI